MCGYAWSMSYKNGKIRWFSKIIFGMGRRLSMKSRVSSPIFVWREVWQMFFYKKNVKVGDNGKKYVIVETIKKCK